MPGQPHAAPAGWYPDANGGQRYWDGAQWLDIPAPGRPTKSRRTLRPAAVIAGAVLLTLAVVFGVGWKVTHDADVREAERQTQLAAERRDAEVEAEAARQAKADSAEKARRALMVVNIEEGIRKMAEEHVSTGILRGPILSVSCSPLGGGSTDDLTAQTTVFECFAANQLNDDGTRRGYQYSATANWTTGSATYKFGGP